MLKRKLPGIAQLLNNTFSLTEYLLFRTHFPICQFCALPREAQRAAEEQSEALGSQSKQEDVLVTVQHTADWFEKKGSGWAINAAVLYFIFGETPEPPGTARRGAARRSPDTLCLLESASPLAALAALGALLSTPPSRGRKWLTETCSMKDVPYLRKYHHSKICNTHTHARQRAARDRRQSPPRPAPRPAPG